MHYNCLWQIILLHSYIVGCQHPASCHYRRCTFVAYQKLKLHGSLLSSSFFSPLIPMFCPLLLSTAFSYCHNEDFDTYGTSPLSTSLRRESHAFSQKEKEDFQAKSKVRLLHLQSEASEEWRRETNPFSVPKRELRL